MNTHCLNCASISTVAILRGGGAVAHFQCDDTKEHRTHLMHAASLECLKPNEGRAIPITAPEEIYATQESGR